jgi:hypothetical protein
MRKCWGRSVVPLLADVESDPPKPAPLQEKSPTQYEAAARECLKSYQSIDWMQPVSGSTG